MASKIEDHGAGNTRRLAAPLPTVQSDKIPQYQAIDGNSESRRIHNAHKRAQENEICRILYLLHINGAMLNWEFLPVKGKRPIDLNGNYLKDWPDKNFSIEECIAAKGATGIGVKTGLHLLVLDFDGETAFHLASEEGINWPMNEGWEVRRDDEPWRYKQLFTPTPEQIALLPNGEFQGKVVTKEAVKDVDGMVIKKAEALEVFLTHKRQVVILGRHPDGGKYYWPPNNEFENLKPLNPPSDEIWNFVLKVANQKKAPSTKSSKARCYPTGSTKRLNPCPICGRNRDLWCAENPDGSIFCGNGSTFSAEIAHGPLKLGDIVADKYAVACIGDDCTTFKPHKERRIYRPHRTTRSKTNIRRAF